MIDWPDWYLVQVLRGIARIMRAESPDDDELLRYWRGYEAGAPGSEEP